MLIESDDEISTKIGGPNIVQGTTYYVIGSSITDTRFQVSATKDGPAVELFTSIGYMYVYGNIFVDYLSHETAGRLTSINTGGTSPDSGDFGIKSV